MHDKRRLRSARARRVREGVRIRPGRQIRNGARVIGVLAGRTASERETHQIHMDFCQRVRWVEQVGDGDAADSVGRRHPDADVDGLGDVVATGADVEGPADTALQLGKGRVLVPAPAVAAGAGLGVECEGFLDASGGVLVAKGCTEGAGLEAWWWRCCGCGYGCGCARLSGSGCRCRCGCVVDS